LGSRSAVTYQTVIADVRIAAGNTADTPCPKGYSRRCRWDVDSGFGTDGRSGHYAVALCLRYTSFIIGRRAVTDVILRASDSSRPPAPPSLYRLVGFWDVEQASYSYYDDSKGGYMMGIYMKTSIIARPPTHRPTPRPTPSPTDKPTPAPTPSSTDRPTPAPTPSPTVPTPAPTHVSTPTCKATSTWTYDTANENCDDKEKGKMFGVKACKSSYQDKLEFSLANQLFFKCKSKCVYDYNSLINDDNGGFVYTKRKCHRFVASGGCFKRKKKRQIRKIKKRALLLCM
jgi:cell division septation protein DedD